MEHFGDDRIFDSQPPTHSHPKVWKFQLFFQISIFEGFSRSHLDFQSDKYFPKLFICLFVLSVSSTVVNNYCAGTIFDLMRLPIFVTLWDRWELRPANSRQETTNNLYYLQSSATSKDQNRINNSRSWQVSNSGCM